MKKLALLQLLLLPLASMVDVTSASEGMAQARSHVVDEERLARSAWDDMEARAVEFGRKLIGLSHAQNPKPPSR